jgi:hypothetical protein
MATIAVTVLYGGPGPNDAILPGISVALDAESYQGMVARVGKDHPLRAHQPPDLSKQGALFLRLTGDTNTRATLEKASRKSESLVLRVGQKPIVPDLRAVLPAQEWLLFTVPRDAVVDRPRIEVIVDGEPRALPAQYLPTP